MLFAGVTTNAGGGYDSTTSIFTCPTSAFYYVYLHLYVGEAGFDCWADINLNGDPVVEVRWGIVQNNKDSVLTFSKTILCEYFCSFFYTITHVRGLSFLILERANS